MKGSRMDPTTEQTIEASVQGSYAGTTDFPSHVRAVAARGVESYRVDFREHASTYFLPSGASHTVSIATHDTPIADAFDEPAVVSAVRTIQRGEIDYPACIDRVMRAGCVG